MKPTKTCSDCKLDLPLDEFHLHPTGRQGCCKVCKSIRNKKNHVTNNIRHNAISKIAYNIEGSSAAFYRLSIDKRAELRSIATDLYESGRSFETFAKETEEKDKKGFVYVIDHPLLQGVKIGRASDPHNRLKGYQTGCPDRAYRLKHAVYFEDCYVAEKTIHVRLGAHQLKGEWYNIKPDEGNEAIEAFARTL